MARLLEIGVTNAVIATLLAIVVWAVARRMRQPALAHMLWVLVLVKLVTPPLVPIPWEFPSAAVTSEPLATVTAIKPAQPILPLPTEFVPPKVAEHSLLEIVDIPTEMPAAASPSPISAVQNIDWKLWLGGLWFAGSAIWLSIAIGRLLRFHFAIAEASLPSDALQRVADEVSAQLGVRRYRLRVTGARLSPLVWPIGVPTIVVPQDLLDILSQPELRAILAHEFAHLRRKDHWVRWLELAATAIYWWHPVVWWVRRAIQQSEELACDAWVVGSNSATAKAYASALFQAVEVATGALQLAPVLASRVTSGGDLKHRIEHVMNATWNPEKSKWGRWAVCLFALCVLPFSLAQVHAENSSTASETTAAPAEPAQIALPPEPWNLQANVQERQITQPEINDASVLRDQVTFLERQFDQIDALYKSGAPGGTIDRQAMAGFELARARGELAFVEGNRTEGVSQFAKAEEFAATALKATAAAYQANRVTLDVLMQASNNLTSIRRRSIQIRRAPAATTDPSADEIAANIQRALAEQSSTESSTPSLAYYRKVVEQQKANVDRMQALADKHVVSAAEMVMAKADYELALEGLRQTERKLESRKLQVKLAEVEWHHAIAKSNESNSDADRFEIEKKRLLIELARSKVRELEE